MGLLNGAPTPTDTRGRVLREVFSSPDGWGVEWIARETRTGARATLRILEELADEGWVTGDHSADGQPSRGSYYRPNFERPGADQMISFWYVEFGYTKPERDAQGWRIDQGDPVEERVREIVASTPRVPYQVDPRQFRLFRLRVLEQHNRMIRLHALLQVAFAELSSDAVWTMIGQVASTDVRMNMPAQNPAGPNALAESLTLAVYARRTAQDYRARYKALRQLCEDAALRNLALSHLRDPTTSQRDRDLATCQLQETTDRLDALPLRGGPDTAGLGGDVIVAYAFCASAEELDNVAAEILALPGAHGVSSSAELQALMA